MARPPLLIIRTALSMIRESTTDASAANSRIGALEAFFSCRERDETKDTKDDQKLNIIVASSDASHALICDLRNKVCSCLIM